MSARAPDPVFLSDRLAHWAEAKPDQTAVTYLDRSWTWSQWWDRVRRLAGALQGLGIGRGDVVSFLDKNHPACVELTFACSMVGAANAIINFRLAGDEVDYAVNDAGSKLLLVGTELMPLVEKLRGPAAARRARPRADPRRRRLATSTRRCWPPRRRSTATPR